MDIDQAGRLAMDLLRANGLTDWTFTIAKMEPEYWASCDCDNRIIMVSPNCPESQIREAILHEISHALVPDDFDHGCEWQACARRLGCTRQDYYLPVVKPD